MHRNQNIMKVSNYEISVLVLGINWYRRVHNSSKTTNH